MTSIETVAELAASILTQPELEAWAMKVYGSTYREIHEHLRAAGRPRSIATIHADVDRANGKIREALDPNHELHTPPPPNRGVYFIQAETGGPIKIGVARDVLRRLDALQIGNPLTLRIIGVITDVDLYDERDMHNRFAHLRLRGEWFTDDPAIHAYLAERTA